jgi:hypothetical protein
MDAPMSPGMILLENNLLKMHTLEPSWMNTSAPQTHTHWPKNCSELYVYVVGCNFSENFYTCQSFFLVNMQLVAYILE